MIDVEFCGASKRIYDALLTGPCRFGFLSEQLILNRIEAQHFAHASEAAPVNRRSTELFQQTAVLGRGIAFVRSEVITGMHGIKFSHQRVAGGLGDDRGGGDTGRERVSFNNAALRRDAVRNPTRINQNKVRL